MTELTDETDKDAVRMDMAPLNVIVQQCFPIFHQKHDVIVYLLRAVAAILDASFFHPFILAVPRSKTAGNFKLSFSTASREGFIKKYKILVMNDCCSSYERKNSHPNRHRCPANGNEYIEVSKETIAHHLKHSWLWDDKDRRFFFCDDPDCDIVYFGDDDSVIMKSQLRTKVGVKEASDSAMLCYCFGVTKADALNDPSIRDFVVTQTKLGLCSCDTSNPSGRCCLKNFPHTRDTK